MPKLSLIISFYNKTKILDKVLESVALQRMQDFEVVIADDGSGQEAVEFIE
jgi:glycosyltransferase involved in cell wall biosynthesis